MPFDGPDDYGSEPEDNPATGSNIPAVVVVITILCVIVVFSIIVSD